MADECSSACARYGETEYNSETAVNVLLDVVQDQSGKTYKSGSFSAVLTSSLVIILTLFAPRCSIVPRLLARAHLQWTPTSPASRPTSTTSLASSSKSPAASLLGRPTPLPPCISRAGGRSTSTKCAGRSQRLSAACRLSTSGRTETSRRMASSGLRCVSTQTALLTI